MLTNRSRLLLTAVVAVPTLAWAACGGDDGGLSDPAQTGSIQVTATTTGDDLDADGYTITVAGNGTRDLAADGSTTFTGVSTGQHQVTLSGLAANCSVTSANPAAASVSGGATASVSFQVVCSALTGFIQVSTSTSGQDLDPDGYAVTLDGGLDRSIGLNGVTTFSGVAVGQRQVELTGISDNCSVTGSNPTTTAVAAGETAQESFNVTCDPLPIGSLEVTTTVTNNFDPDGYQVAVAGVYRGRVDVDGSATFADLPAGAQEVEIADIAPNCAVDGDNPATVDIPVGGTGAHAFSITCTDPPDGRILYLTYQQGKGYFYNIMNADGSGQFWFMSHPGETTPSEGRWSPDGERIAFSSDTNAVAGYHDIYVMNKDGSGLTQLTTDPAFESGPAWSPDGSRIAFTRWLGRGNDFEVFVMNADGTGVQQLTDDPGLSSFDPSWSPDGSMIVFGRTDNWGSMYADNDISVMNADGTGIARINEPAPICDQGFWAGFPAWKDYPAGWSPDGSKILFERSLHCTGDGSTDEIHVFTMDPDGTDILELTPGPEEAANARWSPDGSRIVYRRGDWDGGYTELGVWTMNPDGTGPIQLSQAGSHPDWGP